MDQDTQKILERLRVIDGELSLLRRKRRKLREKLRTLRREAKEIRGRIEEGIEEILRLEGEMKRVKGSLRDEVRRAAEANRERKEIIRELRELRKRVKEIRLPRGSPENWREERKRLELLYETTDMEEGEEKRVVERMKSLAKWISLAEERERLRERIGELVERWEELNGGRSELQGKIDGLRKELERLEETRASLLEEATLRHKRSDELRVKIEAVKGEEEEFSSKIAGKEEERRNLLDELGIEEDLPIDQVVKVLRERDRWAESAKKKLSEKKPLTLEEYAALVKKGLI